MSKKILIVEDEPFLQSLVSKKASLLGYETEVAADGKEAIQKAITQKPDLILLDLIIPVVTGFDVLREIRNNPDKLVSDIPIIIISNLGQREDVEKAMNLGANDFLIKANFSTEEIMQRVAEFLNNLDSE